MKKNTLLNLAMLGIVVVLAIVAMYEPGIEKPAQAPSLIQLNRDTINHIEIHREGQDTIELVKGSNAKWQLQQPLKIAASDFRIDSLLRVTATKSLASFAADKAKLSEYHLDKPRVELVLNDKTRIAFGSSTPLDNRRYVMVDDKVHLITDSLYYHLIGAYTTFIRQKPLPEKASIESLELPVLSVKWENNRWLLEPKPEKYSADQITRLLDAWKLASALQVKPYDGSKGESVTLQLKGEPKPLRFLVTARKPDLVLARPELGIEYHFPAESADEMLALPKLATHKDEQKKDGVN